MTALLYDKDLDRTDCYPNIVDAFEAMIEEVAGTTPLDSLVIYNEFGREISQADAHFIATELKNRYQKRLEVINEILEGIDAP